jgi:outer membrane protein insertion porin family
MVWMIMAPSALQTKEKNDAPIVSLQIEGNKEIRQSNLMPFFKLPLPFPSETFNRSLDKLRAYYLSKGYMDFFVEECQRISLLDKNQHKVVIYLNEGPRYIFGRINYSGNIRLSDEQLQRETSLTQGSTYNPVLLKSDIRRLITLYENSGYPFVSISPDVEADTLIASEKTGEVFLHVQLNIKEGALVRISSYQILGNKQTRDNVLIRETGLFKGEIFNGEIFNQIQENIENLGFFNQVSQPELLVFTDQDHQNQDTLNGIIQLAIEEGNSNVFDGIVGYQPGTDNEDGFFTGYVNMLLKNMFGTGRKLQVEWNKPNRETQDVKLKYMEPWVFQLPVHATLNFEQLKQDTIFSKFYLGADLSYQFSRQLAVNVTVSKETINSIGNPETDASVGILNSSTFITGFGLTFDTRDFKLNPRRGLYINNQYLFGQKSFAASDSLLTIYDLKPDLSEQIVLADAELYIPTFSRMVLAASVHAKALISDQIDPADWFRFGGSRDLRGYREQQFAASQLVYSNLEYRYLLSRLAFAFLFFDAGYFYRAQNPFNSQDMEVYDQKTGYGFGARVESPLGLLKVSYALGEGLVWSNGLVHVGLVNEF